MHEIFELLGEDRLHVTNIVKDLSRETRLAAPELLQRGGTALLAYNMSYHAERGRYFVAAGGHVRPHPPASRLN